jgi:hypothetical protein
MGAFSISAERSKLVSAASPEAVRTVWDGTTQWLRRPSTQDLKGFDFQCEHKRTSLPPVHQVLITDWHQDKDHAPGSGQRIAIYQRLRLHEGLTD